MKKLVSLVTITFFATIIFAQESNNYSKNQLIIKLTAESKIDFKSCLINQKFNHKTLDSLSKELNVKSIKLTGNKKIGKTYLLTFKSRQNIERLIEIYKKVNILEYAEPNFIGTGGGQRGLLRTVPGDTYFSRQYGLHNNGTFSLSTSTVDADIDMDLGWDLEKGSQSVVVAVLDAGAKLNHPEFNGRIWQNTSETINNIDTDNNGYIDDIRGWDFANADNDPSDDHGHGTNVMGIIGANGNNNLGYAGVDWHCKLMVCKILNANNSGLYTWWTDAIYYAVDNGADVINMSVGGSGFSLTMQTAINYAFTNGVTVVACMMNEDNNVTYYPAGYLNTIAVGSTNSNDQRSSPFFWRTTSGSNYGAHIDVVAPGNFIYGLSHLSNTNYGSYWGGTSQATPLVTGLSALLLAQDSSRTPTDIRTIIRNSAEDRVGNIVEDVVGFDNYYGFGRINAHQALLQLTVNINKAVKTDSRISIYPNPTSEYLFIESKLNYNQISIINAIGIETYRNDAISNTEFLKIDISAFTKGLYIVNLKDQDGSSMTSKKVLVQ